MDQDQKEKSKPETLLAAWMKATAEFWGEMAKMGPVASETIPLSEENIKTRPQELWQSTLKMWQSMFSTLSEPGTTDTLFKGINMLPEIVLRMAKTGWDGYFYLQQQWLERVGKIGKHTEAYKFEDLDQNVFKAWTEIYEKEFKQFLTVPQLGLTRYYQERMGVAIDKFNLFQAKMAEFFRLLYLPVEKSFRIMQEKIGELTREGKLPENQKEYYLMWLKILEGHYMTLFKSPEYTRILSNTLNVMEEFLMARQIMLQDIIQTLPVPSNKDMDDLYKELYLLKKKVKEIEKKLDKV
ncbi:MAG: poly(R)-hydroxyalkanoic acid synthase subunit PhaE [Thermodesulfobacteriota bacterium]|nr:poly(R)-hydroxyalkanoic acid synthase subunit PhaE [Thermodesulfobacteriota bacterium]